MSRLLLFVTLGTALLAGACSDQGPDDDDVGARIQVQRGIWEAQKPATYVYDVERLCFCAEEARGPVRVFVVDGAVHARVYTGDGTPVAGSFAELFPHVDGLFDILEDAVERDAYRIQVTWDPVTGAPLDFWVDYSAQLADEEQGYRMVSAPGPEG